MQRYKMLYSYLFQGIPVLDDPLLKLISIYFALWRLLVGGNAVILILEFRIILVGTKTRTKIFK